MSMFNTFIEQTEGQIALSIGIFLLFLLFRKLFTKYIFQFFLKISRKTPTDFFTNVMVSFEKPVSWLFVVVGLYISLTYFPYFDTSHPFVIKLLKVTIVALFTWGLYNLTSTTSSLFAKINEKTNFQIDKILIPFLSKAIRFIIIAISITIIAQEFGYNVTGFVAGLGLGGLAFAFAAKDAIANIFGGFIIITEKPFTIGEWIATPSVEGTVEDITFRSTKVRTFAQALVTVPNSTLANETITNWSKMGKRRIQFHLGVSYETPPNKLKNAIGRIEELLKNHEGVHPETIFVKLDQFSESSLTIFLYFFTKTTIWEEFLNIKQDINFKILDILEQEGVAIAFPSRTLYVSNKQEVEGVLPLSRKPSAE